MKNLKFLFCLILVLVVFSLVAREGWSAFRLTLTPYEGEFDLLFGRINAAGPKVVKELTIAVTTDIGKRYRVYQRVLRPLTSDGIEINPDQFKMYTDIDSNSRGTLERLEEHRVTHMDTLLYTSNTSGDSDSFRVVYTIEPFASQVPGFYTGRLQFILLPIDSTQDEEKDEVNMFADLTNEGAIEITTETGFKRIYISSKDLDSEVDLFNKVYISVKGNMGARYRIYQQLGDNLVRSADGDQFDLEKVEFEVMEQDIVAAKKTGNLSELRSKSLIYVSDDLGSSNQIAITYKPTADFSQLKANLYTGAIDYSLELDRVTGILDPGIIDSIDVEFDVESIFRIVAVSISKDGKEIAEGKTALQFGKVGYKGGIKESRVRVRVESNMQKPYLVTQKFSGPLQDSEGNRIPKNLFTFYLEKEEDTEATLKFVKDAIVETEKDIPVFISNRDGDSDDFEIIYKLKTTGDTQAGDYNTGLSFSLSEL